MMKYFILAILGIIAGFLEVGVLPFLPGWFVPAPLFVGTVILIVTSSRARALTFALAGALVLSGYGIFTFDIPILHWLLIVFALSLVSQRFLTNRSLYATTALLFLGRLLDWFLHFLFSEVGRLFGGNYYIWSLPSNVLSTLLWDQFVGMTLFILFAVITRRFSPHVGRSNSFAWQNS